MPLSLPNPELQVGSMMPGAYFVTNAIRENMTNDEFDDILQREEANGFQLHFGGRCGGTILEICLTLQGRVNYNLAEHIIRIGKEQVLNVGKDNGCAPLRLVVHIINNTQDEERKHRLLEIAKIMIKNGANPNLMKKNGGKETGTTPYFSALISNNRELIELFQQYGGMIPKSLEDITMSENDFSIFERHLGYTKKVFFNIWNKHMKFLKDRELSAVDSLETLAARAIINNTHNEEDFKRFFAEDNYSITPQVKEIIRHFREL